MNYSGFNTLADQYGFAVCYPNGTQDFWGDNFWNVGYNFHAGSNVDDVDFLISLAHELQTSYNLSSINTFITGMSNGAELCYLIACESSGTFSAYAPVAGTIFTNGLPNGSCNGNPSPIFEIHGVNDNVSYFSGDPNDQFWGPYLGIDSILDFWVNTNGLDILEIDTLPNVNNNNKYTTETLEQKTIMKCGFISTKMAIHGMWTILMFNKKFGAFSLNISYQIIHL